MAVDLYVGPVSRYIVGDWKNLGRQAAEAHGLQYQVVGPGVRQPPKGFFAKRRADRQYAVWREGVRKFSEAMGETSPLWDDSPHLDYATDRPGWEGVSGLIVKYASLLHPEFEEPATIPSQEEVHTLPAAQAAAKAGGPFHAVAMPRMWIPGGFESVRAVDWVEGGEMPTASLGSLNAALDQMCALWGKDRAEFRDMPTDQPMPEAPLDEAALYGLAVYSRLAEIAKARNLPMILDA